MSIARIRDQNVSFDPQALAAARRNPNRPKLQRRAILRAAAACIALPTLESLLSPAEARAFGAQPLRWVSWFLPCGVWGPSWFPTTTGVDYELSPTLAPLAPFKSKVLVFAGLQNTAAVNPQGSHGCGPPGMTTCRQGQKPAINVGISVDQVYAQALGTATRIPSMQLSVVDTTFSDVQYPAVYNGTTAWASATQPLPPVISPGQVFDQLFAGQTASSTDVAAQAALAKRRALHKSVLDEVTSEANALMQRLGTTDRAKLDEYLTSVRAAEVTINQSGMTPSCDAGTSARPADKIADVPTHTKALIDLMVLAFQCDATRVINFQQANGGHSSYSSFPWINLNVDHHGISHHNGDANKGAQLAKIDLWEMTNFAYFLQKMDAVAEGNGTMLDNSLVFLSNELSDGNAHNQGATKYTNFTGPTGKPIVLAGSAGGKLNTGRHAIYNNASQADLFIALLNMLDVPVTTFGTAGTAPLTGLT
jgi:Protein of unknown function (DUF1552)